MIKSGVSVQYRVNILLSQTRVQQRLFVRLVVWVTMELVSGDISSSEVQSSTESVSDTYCRGTIGRVCGHKNETPSCPVIHINFELKYHGGDAVLGIS